MNKPQTNTEVSGFSTQIVSAYSRAIALSEGIFFQSTSRRTKMTIAITVLLSCGANDFFSQQFLDCLVGGAL